MIENDDKPNKLTTLIFNIIAIVGVAVVFRLLPRFSQKVHLLYPVSRTFGICEVLRTVNGDFQNLMTPLIFAENS